MSDGRVIDINKLVIKDRFTPAGLTRFNESMIHRQSLLSPAKTCVSRVAIGFRLSIIERDVEQRFPILNKHFDEYHSRLLY